MDLFQKDPEQFYFAISADGTEYLTELPVGTKDAAVTKPKAKAKKAAKKKPASKLRARRRSQPRKFCPNRGPSSGRGHGGDFSTGR